MAEAVSLVLISGAVASGKTTLALRVAALARVDAVAAASIDMDELVETVAGSDWTQVTREHRLQACELAARLIDSLSRQGSRFVAISGSTLATYEWDEVLDRVEVAVRPIFVRLRVSVAEAIRRAQADPMRIVTRNPDVVTRLHEAIDWSAAGQPDLEIKTDGMTAEAVADAVMARVRSAGR